MKRREKVGRRILAGVLGAVLVVTAAPCSRAAEADNSIRPAYDEAYYATLDYYGNLTDSSIVKSYTLNGAGTLTDFGAYDAVNNLTDSTEAVIKDGKVEFDFGETAPERFYFEGKTQQPFAQLPWTLSMSYTLNGVPARAEDLAGKTGVVEITVNAAPNPAASEYTRNNYVLEAAAVFNADDILSLEAEGAQTQLIGNLRMVLFLAMPGEEQQFVMRVGAEEFTFSGMTFLMVPATLAQLSDIAALRDAKEEMEDSYQALNDSMDTMLNALDGISSGLTGAAAGLDQLDDARAQISAGKGDVYHYGDAALRDLDAVQEAVAPVSGHLDTAKSALTYISGAVTELTNTAVSLKPRLQDTRSVLTLLQKDLENAKTLLSDLEEYEDDARRNAQDMQKHLAELSDDADALRGSMADLRTGLGKLNGLSAVGEVTYNGMTIPELKETVKTLQAAHKAYEESPYAGSIDFETYLANSGDPNIAANAAALNELYEASLTSDYAEIVAQAETANELIGAVNKKIEEINRLLKNLAVPTANMLSDLEDLCDCLGDKGLGGDLQYAAGQMEDILKDLQAHSGEGASGIQHMQELTDALEKALAAASDTLDRTKTLTDTANAYVPAAQDAFTDAKKLAVSAESGIANTNTFLRTLKTLMQRSGATLDAGAQQTLGNFAAVLRKAADSLDSTGNVRDAKNNITGIIDEKWEAFTGENNNLLRMDPDASPVSLTSPENASPISVQVLLRSQEIKVEAPEAPEEVQAPEEADTFFRRVARMFQDFWAAVTGIFQ